jgi:hypothetical protein
MKEMKGDGLKEFLIEVLSAQIFDGHFLVET